MEQVNTAYHLLDLVPKGRDEEGPPSTMAWLRHHDRYEDQVVRVPGGLERPRLAGDDLPRTGVP